MAIQRGFAFARCPDGLKVVLEGVVSAEDADAWAQARQNAERNHCDPESVFILPYSEAMRVYGEVIRNHRLLQGRLLMASTEPQATPQPPDGLPVIEPVQHVRLTPAWVDPHDEAPNFWLLEVPGVPDETAEMRMMISERHVVEMLVTFGRVIFYGENREPVEAALRLAGMFLLRDTDSETIQALRALLLERTSGDGGR